MSFLQWDMAVGRGGGGRNRHSCPGPAEGDRGPQFFPSICPRERGEEGLAAVATAQHCWMDGAAPARYKVAPALRNWNHHRNCSYDTLTFCKSRVQVQYLLEVRIFGHLLNSFPWADHHFPPLPLWVPTAPPPPPPLRSSAARGKNRKNSQTNLAFCSEGREGGAHATEAAAKQNHRGNSVGRKSLFSGEGKKEKAK